MSETGAGTARVILYVGAVHSGKTGRLERLVKRAQTQGRSVAGILAPSLWHDGKLLGFDVVDITTGERRPLATRTRHRVPTVGDFVFDPNGLALGRDALVTQKALNADLVVVDEFGPLELSGGGYRESVDRLACEASGTVLLVVRDDLSDAVGRLYHISEDRMITSDGSADHLMARLFDGSSEDGD